MKNFPNLGSDDIHCLKPFLKIFNMKSKNAGLSDVRPTPPCFAYIYYIVIYDGPVLPWSRDNLPVNCPVIP